MIFNCDKELDLFEANPSLNSFQEFRAFKDDQDTLRWLFLTYDYDTPYRRIPIEQRKTTVGISVGLKTRRTKSSMILDRSCKDIVELTRKGLKEAFDRFMTFQFDEDKDLLMVYDEQINKIKNMVRGAMDKATDMQKVNKMLIEEVPKIREAKKTLMEMLGIRKEDLKDSTKTALEEALE